MPINFMLLSSVADSSSAVAAPIPREAPVTTARRRNVTVLMQTAQE